MLRKTLILMLILEALSLLSFKFPAISLPLLIGIGVAVFAVSLKNLESGVYILFGELFIGSRGHLLEYGFVSLRMVIFAGVFLAWLIKRIMNREFGIKGFVSVIPKNKFLLLYLALLFFVGWGAALGLIRNNGLMNVFLDANGYLYLLILPAVLAGIKTGEATGKIFKILGAAILFIGLKTLLLFVWFTFGWPGVAALYHWTINFEIGEITGAAGSASRIFMQSQFWALVGLFIFSMNFHNSPRPSLVSREGIRWAIIVAAILSIILSLSRSFWLGGFVAAVFADLVLIFYLKVRLSSVIKWGFSILGLAILMIGLLFGLTQLGGGSLSETILSRGVNPAEEAAGGARLLELPVLFEGAKKSPILGSGFGSEISFPSYLPDRVTAENPTGEITSYAFEWGYLDIWLKIGIIGTLVYLFFIAHIFKQGWSKLKAQSSNVKILGTLSGLVGLAVLHITTPYLNHPLGIGYLILCYLAFRDYAPATS